MKMIYTVITVIVVMAVLAVALTIALGGVDSAKGLWGSITSILKFG